jgi:hypothetical protein
MIAKMVKLLLDEEITKTLTSANSINVVVGCHKYIFSLLIKLYKKIRSWFSVPNWKFWKYLCRIYETKTGLPIKLL